MLTAILIGSASVALVGAPVALVWASHSGRMDAWWQRESARPVRPTPTPPWLRWFLAIWGGYLLASPLAGMLGLVLSAVGVRVTGTIAWFFAASFVALWVAASRWIFVAIEDGPR